MAKNCPLEKRPFEAIEWNVGRWLFWIKSSNRDRKQFPFVILHFHWIFKNFYKSKFHFFVVVVLNIVDIYLTAGLVNGFPDSIDQCLSVYLSHSVILHILSADTIIPCKITKIFFLDKYIFSQWLESDGNILVLML